MELLQLRDFRAVVETGSINGAAKKLGLTQPPVSMQIR
ncbi:MAG TPA: LysR family transcriptional regulator, partial [Candidatus Limiplasma sp.]|nr:LysR family transcriptional regulator [Candidatus Limiplasma sp.]